MMKRQISGAEKVHPYEEAPPLQYPAVGSYNNTQHGAVHMPNDLMRKEQKEGLLEQPAALNSNEIFNQEAQIAPVQRRRRQRRRRCVRCCCCAGACVGAVMVIIGILVMLFFLVLHPKLPKYTITEGSISQFSMNNSTSTSSSSAAIASSILGGGGAEDDDEEAGTVYLNVEMQLRARLRNPNRKIGLDYRELSGRLLYEGVEIGKGSIPAFYQGHKNTTYVWLAMQGENIPLTPSLAKTLANTLSNEESLLLHARAIVVVRLKIGHWKSPNFKVRVKCTVQLSNPTRGTVRLLHNSCKFKLLGLHL